MDDLRPIALASPRSAGWCLRLATSSGCSAVSLSRWWTASTPRSSAAAAGTLPGSSTNARHSQPSAGTLREPGFDDLLTKLGQIAEAYGQRNRLMHDAHAVRPDPFHGTARSGGGLERPPSSGRVRRQGLEPRTRGLRVRWTAYRLVSAHAGQCRFVRNSAGAGTASCQSVPVPTVTDEHPTEHPPAGYRP
jgi:hypothetical protein